MGPLEIQIVTGILGSILAGILTRHVPSEKRVDKKNLEHEALLERIRNSQTIDEQIRNHIVALAHVFNEDRDDKTATALNKIVQDPVLHNTVVEWALAPSPTERDTRRLKLIEALNNMLPRGKESGAIEGQLSSILQAFETAILTDPSYHNKLSQIKLDEVLKSTEELKEDHGELKEGQQEIKQLILALMESLPKAGITLKSRKKHFVVPFRPNTHFADPHGCMEKLRQGLTVQGRAAVTQVQAISGLGGVGKTQLAVQYAHQYREGYSAVLWVRAESGGTLGEASADQEASPAEELQAAVAALAAPRALGLKEYGQEQNVQYDAVRGWLADNDGWLTVIDNADSEEAVRAVTALADSLHGGHVLITSRRSFQGFANIADLPLDTLSEDEAVQFLLDRTRSGEDQREDARDVARLLGGLFLALEQAAAWVTEPGNSFGKYLDRAKEFEEHIALLAQKVDGGTHYGRSVATTWRVTVESLGPLAQNILRLMAWYASTPIPEKLLHSKEEPEWTPADDLLTRTAIDDALAELARYSLIRRDEYFFTVHRLLKAVLYAELEKEDRPLWARWAVDQFNAFAPATPDDVRTWPVWDILRPHAEQLYKMADKLEVGDAMALFLNEFGLHLHSKAQHTEAEPLMRRHLEIFVSFTRATGHPHPHLQAAIGNYAVLLEEMGKTDDEILTRLQSIAPEFIRK